MHELIEAGKGKMEKTVEAMKQEFTTIRAGRANPGILDKITVDYYGVPTAINAVAAISVAEARILVVQPWDATLLKPIEKAILASDIGINPTNDGTVIRIVFPQPTEERRKELVKQAHKYSEDAKIAVRNIRRDIIDKFKAMKKKSEITEDDLKTYEKDTQKITDKYIELIEKATAEKEKEIMTV
jgi:ribosome recycling factor